MIDIEKDDHLKFIKKLANKNFSIDPSEELYILFELIGWNNQSVSENFSFYHIIEQVENMETQEDYLLSEFALFYLEGWGLNQMEVSSEKNDKNEEFEEEEKIDTSSRPKMIINPNMIPTWWYMITPDLYFTLPKFCRTLEEMTKKYYNKKCSLCKSISKRSAIWIVCEEYLWVAKWNFDSKSKDYGKGNLTLHSEKWGGGSSIFIGPVEGQLIYIYNGLAMEAKSPYVDKYGEWFDENEKKYDTYSLDDIQYDKIREDILDFNIPNTVITKRAGMTRVYRQNVF